MKYLTGIISICALFFLNACIENDIPYPRIKAEILTISAEGQLEEPEINKDNRTVHFRMNEGAHINQVLIENLNITEDAVISPDLDSLSVLDLRDPKKFTLSIYQDYEWTISAEQPIERYFKVNNQVGGEYIDYENKTAIAYVEEGTDLKSIEILSLKLGPVDTDTDTTLYIPNYEKLTDFTQTGGVSLVVVYHGYAREQWTLFVTEGETSTHSVNAWERVAWLKGSGRAEGNNGFEYKEAGTDSWIPVDKSLITSEGGVFTARLSNLTEGKTYISRAYTDADYSEELTFIMGTSQQLPNSSFENWQKPGKPYLFYGEGEQMFWDSGNHGSTTISDKSNITTPDNTTKVSGDYSVKLESDFVGVLGIGKFAAGNLFAGEYLETVDLTNGRLGFGRPFTKHPTKLKFWYKGEVGTIDYINADELPEITKGMSDHACVYIALGDWDAPVEILTKKGQRKIFNPASPNVIAYGELIIDKNVPNWTEHTIELEYRTTSRNPKYIVVVASASRWGEYFVGSTKSVLWLDDFELIYD